MYIFWMFAEWALAGLLCVWILVRLWIACVYVCAAIVWTVERMRRLLGFEPHFTFAERRKMALTASPTSDHSKGTAHLLATHHTAPAK
jgi:hypothetical protein